MTTSTATLSAAGDEGHGEPDGVGGGRTGGAVGRGDGQADSTPLPSGGRLVRARQGRALSPPLHCTTTRARFSSSVRAFTLGVAATGPALRLSPCNQRHLSSGPSGPGPSLPTSYPCSGPGRSYLHRAYALCATLCAAQTPDEVRRDAQIHLGVALPHAALRDEGVRRRQQRVQQCAGRGATSPSRSRRGPGVDTVRPSCRASPRPSATDVVYYQRYASERSHQSGHWRSREVFLGRCTFRGSGYLRTRQRPNLEIDARSLRQEHSLKAGVRRPRLSSKVSARSPLDQTRSTTPPARASTMSSFRRRSIARPHPARARSALRHHAADDLHASRRVGASDRFEFSPLRDADSTAVFPASSSRPRAGVRTGAVGFRRFSPIRRARRPFSGVVTSPSLTTRCRARPASPFTADRDLTYSYERLQPVLRG